MGGSFRAALFSWDYSSAERRLLANLWSAEWPQSLGDCDGHELYPARAKAFHPVRKLSENFEPDGIAAEVELGQGEYGRS